MKKILLFAIIITIAVAYLLSEQIKHVTSMIVEIESKFGRTKIQVTNKQQESKTSSVGIQQIGNRKQMQTTKNTPQNTEYKDGIYTGTPADAVYGNIQVSVEIANGRMTNIKFLQFPNDQSTSTTINQFADPQLAQEAIQSQSSNVDIITSASDTSQAFIISLKSALAQAKQLE